MTSYSEQAIELILSGNKNEAKKLLLKHYHHIFLIYIRNKYNPDNILKTMLLIRIAITRFINLLPEILKQNKSELLLIAEITTLINSIYKEQITSGIFLNIYNEITIEAPIISEQVKKTIEQDFPIIEEILKKKIDYSISHKKDRKYDVLLMPERFEYITRALNELVIHEKILRKTKTLKKRLERCKKIFSGYFAGFNKNEIIIFFSLELTAASLGSKMSECLDHLYELAYKFYQNDLNKKK